MLGSHRLGDIIEVRRLAKNLNDGCVCTVRWPAVLLKLKLVPRPSLITKRRMCNTWMIANLLKYVCAKNFCNE